MEYTSIDGQKFCNMLINGCNALNEKKDYVNSLNVFPVPDGDTGTNMYMTYKAASNEVKFMKNSTVGEIAKVFSKGALMGARGNSGVILSQIFRGIANGLSEKEEISSQEFTNAIAEGAKSAYKAVMRPTEGTILTVVKAASEAAANCKSEDFLILLKDICDGAEEMLNMTPEMLPALKKAQVVDAGGMGLLIILKGMYAALKENLEVSLVDDIISESNVTRVENHGDENIEFGYCTEFFIYTDKVNPENFKDEIKSLGDSIIVVGMDGIVKVHIHTNEPGNILTMASKHGELSKIKIDNMREQHRKILEAEYNISDQKDVNIENKEYAFISVSMGEGIREIFEKELGVDFVIDGGQTMNPSTQDFLDCINKLNAKNILVFPNNKNIILSANQASSISDKNVVVIPTKTITQGVTALTTFNPDASVEDNIAAMNDSLTKVKSGTVTYAVRDTEVDGISIKSGDILGLIENKISVVGKNPNEVCEKIIDQMTDSESELISLYKGKDVNDEDCESIVELLEDKYSELDILSYDGKQPLYYYIVSVE